MKLTRDGIRDKKIWKQAGISTPMFDIQKMLESTTESPEWVHFGAGNIFRAYIAKLSQDLLNQNLVKTGIIAVESFDYEIIEKAYVPFDNLSLLVGLMPDGSTDKEVIASVADSICADATDTTQWEKLHDIFKCPTLQLASFTITEKGYAVCDSSGEYLPIVVGDIENGIKSPRHIMSIITTLMHSRFKAGASPLALVSMDNCSRNGEVLQNSVLTIAKEWHKKAYVESNFIDYLSDENRVSFPWSMIDKITPYPANDVYKELAKLDISNMDLIKTSKNSFTAPFTNAEIPGYLVIEDKFPNGRPPFEKVKVYMADKETVNKTEKMKVTTCLNPLHTALAVYGCLLGFTTISDMMKDADLVALVNRLGYAEGIPVAVDPKIIKPHDFIQEVIEQRFPNPFMPDTPQRIATDTSQKVGIRFGETIKAYTANPNLDTSSLVAIPLAIAAWLRYLLALDDNGKKITLSPDPMLDEMQEHLKNIRFGEPNSLKNQLRPILSNTSIFGVDLYEARLGEKIENYFREMIIKPGSVRNSITSLKNMPLN